jgi:hypothetical protein
MSHVAKHANKKTREALRREFIPDEEEEDDDFNSVDQKRPKT